MMTYYHAEDDALPIVKTHCREQDQNLTLYPLREAPSTRPDYEYIVWEPLTWEHVNHLSPGDRICFQDSKKDWWEIYIHQYNKPVDRQGLEKLIEVQSRIRGE